MVNYSGLNPVFAARISAAIADAEAATGHQAQVMSAVRTYAQQAQLYNDYITGHGGVAAHPGKSLHEQGMALDLAPGPVRDWIEAHAADYGLEPASSKRGWGFDPPHIQLARGIAATPYDKTPNMFAGGSAVAYADKPSLTAGEQAVNTMAGGPGARMLRKGMSGPDVGALQQRLSAAGFNPGKIDNAFGPRTQAALVAYQKAQGLSPDGVAGPQIFARMNGGTASDDILSATQLANQFNNPQGASADQSLMPSVAPNDYAMRGAPSYEDVVGGGAPPAASSAAPATGFVGFGPIGRGAPPPSAAPASPPAGIAFNDPMTPTAQQPLSRVPPGPAGAEAVVRASLGQDPRAITSAWQSLINSAPDGKALDQYFRSLPADIQKATAQNFAWNPTLWNAVPETAKATGVLGGLQSMFAGAPPPLREPLQRGSQYVLTGSERGMTGVPSWIENPQDWQGAAPAATAAAGAPAAQPTFPAASASKASSASSASPVVHTVGIPPQNVVDPSEVPTGSDQAGAAARPNWPYSPTPLGAQPQAGLSAPVPQLSTGAPPTFPSLWGEQPAPAGFPVGQSPNDFDPALASLNRTSFNPLTEANLASAARADALANPAGGTTGMEGSPELAGGSMWAGASPIDPQTLALLQRNVLPDNAMQNWQRDQLANAVAAGAGPKMPSLPINQGIGFAANNYYNAGPLPDFMDRLDASNAQLGGEIGSGLSSGANAVLNAVAGFPDAVRRQAVDWGIANPGTFGLPTPAEAGPAMPGGAAAPANPSSADPNWSATLRDAISGLKDLDSSPDAAAAHAMAYPYEADPALRPQSYYAPPTGRISGLPQIASADPNFTPWAETSTTSQQGPMSGIPRDDLNSMYMNGGREIPSGNRDLFHARPTQPTPTLRPWAVADLSGGNSADFLSGGGSSNILQGGPHNWADDFFAPGDALAGEMLGTPKPSNDMFSGLYGGTPPASGSVLYSSVGPSAPADLSTYNPPPGFMNSSATMFGGDTKGKPDITAPSAAGWGAGEPATNDTGSAAPRIIATGSAAPDFIAPGYGIANPPTDTTTFDAGPSISLAQPSMMGKTGLAGGSPDLAKIITSMPKPGPGGGAGFGRIGGGDAFGRSGAGGGDSFGGIPGLSGLGSVISAARSAGYGTGAGSPGYFNLPSVVTALTSGGYSPPNFSTGSGGAIYAYKPNGQGGGTYVNSFGQTMSY